MSETKDFRSHPGDIEAKAEHLERMAEGNRARKKRLYPLMGVQAGRHVLDVGCGVGMDTIPFGEIVGPSGRVVGIDQDADSIARAAAAAAEAGVSGWVTHRVADAYALPFEDNSFDACYSERLFMHLDDPEAVLAEMVRVAKPGGAIAIVDVDGATISMDSS